MKNKPPSLQFLFSHQSHLIACGFGSGLSPVAPGTVGTLFAWLTFPLLGLISQRGEVVFAFLVVCFAVGVFAVGRTGRDLGVVDHGSIVWDEIVPFWMVLFFCPSSLIWQGGAFLLFRLFDIFKPQPAKFFDEKVKNGFGVMADDLVAGAYTVAVLFAIQYLLS